jgi:lipopolysaccharide/colanic/teichoic acid biosynthesis glycosyltransferase
MTKRLFDISLSILLICVFTPIMIITGLLILFLDGKPVFYFAERVGFNREKFKLIKFRTMIESQSRASVITAHNDDRVYPLGRVLRIINLDDLPQLFNILEGKMSFVGPRPEDPQIVDKHYTNIYYKTLKYLPGLVSPGSLFNYTHGELLIDINNPEKNYIEKILPLKLSIDLLYMSKANIYSDIALIFKTIYITIMKVSGKNNFEYPKEYYEAIKR